MMAETRKHQPNGMIQSYAGDRRSGSDKVRNLPPLRNGDIDCPNTQSVTGTPGAIC